jgi:tetratricopeptide (TPR) repeat protein
VQQLVALGYVAEDQAHDARQAAIAARADYHRAMVHLDAFEWAAAVEPLRRVVAARPGDLQVAFALSLVGGLDECRSLADAVSANPALAPYAEAIRGLIASAEGRDADAVAAFVACERGAPPTGFLLDRLGWAYLRLGRLEEAERVLRRSRELEPEGRFAPFALAGILLDRDRPAEAAEEALQAIGRHYRWPEAHARLGVALAQLGRTREAVRAFEISIAQRPSALAHEALATIHEQAAGDPRQVAFHRERARELRTGAGP